MNCARCCCQWLIAGLGGIKGRVLLKYVWDVAAVWSEEGPLCQWGQRKQQYHKRARVTVMWSSVVTRTTSTLALRHCVAQQPLQKLTTFSKEHETHFTGWVTDWPMASAEPGDIQKTSDACFVLYTVDISSQERKIFKKKEKKHKWRHNKPRVSQWADAHI